MAKGKEGGEMNHEKTEALAGGQVALVQYFVEGEDGGDVTAGSKFCLIDKKRFRENWKAEHEALERRIAEYDNAGSVMIHNIIWVTKKMTERKGGFDGA